MDGFNFIVQVYDFVGLWCKEYARDVSVVIDIDDEFGLYHEAEITITDFDGIFWEVPIMVSEHYSNTIAIDIGDAGELSDNGAGLYAFLWHEACRRLKDQPR